MFNQLKHLAAPATLMAMMLFPAVALGQLDAQRVFEVSALNTLLARAPQAAIEVAQQLGADEPVLSIWEASALTHLAPEMLTGALESEFIDALEHDAVDAIVAFRQSDLGKAITEAEAAENSSAGDAARAQPGHISLERRELYRDLAELTAPLDAEGHVMLLVRALLTPLLPQTEVETALEELAGIFDERPVLDVEIDRVSRTFGRFSDSELITFIAHLESAGGQAFLRAKATSEDSVFRRGVAALAEDFAALAEAQ